MVFKMVVLTPKSDTTVEDAFRSSRSQMFFKIGVLKNFAIFTRKQYFQFLFKFLGIIGRKRLVPSFWIMIWIYYYLSKGIRLDLDLNNSCWIRKIPKFATNNITIWFFTHQTWYDLEKLNLLNLIVLLTASQITQVSFHTFLTASLLGYNKINLSPVSQSKCFQVQVEYTIKSVQLQ